MYPMTLREGHCVPPFPQLHTSYKTYLVTGQDRCDCKRTKRGKWAVMKGLGNVILICGSSKACPEFLPAGGGGTCSTGQLGCENDRDSPELPERLHCWAHRPSRAQGYEVGLC